MKATVVETLLYLMIVRFSPLAAEGIVTGVSLVGGSGPHEGTVQIVGVSYEGGQLSFVKGYASKLLDWDARALCRTLGYPGVNKVFSTTPYSTNDIEESGFHLRCRETLNLTTLIGCPASMYQPGFEFAVKCQNDIRYLGCFRDTQEARPLANSTCPPGPNTDYSCIDTKYMTTKSCLEYCRTLNDSDVIFTYAAVRAGMECTCGVDTAKLVHLSDYYDCYSPCSGDLNYSTCGGQDYIAAYNITSEPDEQDATNHCVRPFPDPADAATTADAITTADTTTPTDTTTPAKANGDSCVCGSVGILEARTAGIGVGIIAVLLTALAVVNVYIYAQTRRQEVKNRMTLTKLTLAGAVKATSGIHGVYQPLTTPLTSDNDAKLDGPVPDEGNNYENAHAGVSVMAMEMEPIYEEARPGSEEVMTKTTDDSDCFYEPVHIGGESAVSAE